MASWSHPRIENPDCRMDRTEEIAAEAKAAFERRRDTYPQLVAARKIDADEARQDIEAWRAIAKDWLWRATGQGEPARRLTIDARIDALDTAIARWLTMVDAKAGSMSKAENEQGALLCAMRCWAEKERADYLRPFPTTERQAA